MVVIENFIAFERNRIDPVKTLLKPELLQCFQCRRVVGAPLRSDQVP